VVTGTNNSQTIRVQNSGNAALSVNPVQVSGTGFSLSGLALPLNLSAGQSSTFNVVFAPQSAGSVSGNVVLTSNDPNSPSTAIPLSGTGSAATFVLNASSSALNFGSVILGSNNSQTVTLSNGGNSNINIQTISASGAGFSATGATAPLTLTPGQSVSLSIVFAPTGSGSITGSIQISSNASGSPLSITLNGTGVQPVSHSTTLSWAASTSVVVGYNVYRASVSGGPYTKLNTSLVSALTYADSAVQAGQTYFYVVTAVDSSGVESVFSNEATATIPTP
jgi:Abnormal spindle-like microcephaly-assoc'd, ASPM-SPD-2-Hydin